MYAETGVSRSAAMSNGDSMIFLPYFFSPQKQKTHLRYSRRWVCMGRERTRVFYARTTRFAGETRHQRPLQAGLVSRPLMARQYVRAPPWRSSREPPAGRDIRYGENGHKNRRKSKRPNYADETNDLAYKDE